MQTVAKGAGFITTKNVLRQVELFLGPFQELRRREALRRLRRTARYLSDDHVAIQMHVNPQLDGFGFDHGLDRDWVGLRRLAFLMRCFFVICFHRW